MAIVESIFGELAQGQNMQALIDNQIELLYGKSIWRNHLEWGLPQTDLTFETVIGRSRIQAAASIVDEDAPAPKRGTPSLEYLKGKIPTMKEMFELNKKDYRALMMLQNLPISDEQKKQLLIKKLWDVMLSASISTDLRIDIMFLQGISTFEIDAGIINNPDGVDFGTVPLLASADQKRTVTVAWTDPTADPFRDIRNVVRYAADSGRAFKEIWIDQTLWFAIQELAAVKAAISGYQNPGTNAKYLVTLDRVNEFLVANGLPMFVLQNHRKGIEKDGKTQTINPFKKENIVFVPDGKLGIVHNAFAIEDWDDAKVDGISYAKYDRAVVSKWRDNQPWREYTQVELNAFPALEAIDGIFLLQSDVITV
jgi:hypothetical protein